MDSSQSPMENNRTNAGVEEKLKDLELQLENSAAENRKLREENERLQIQLDERVMMTEVLHENEQQFRALVATIPGAVYRIRLDSEWIIEFISDAIEEITAFPASHFKWQPAKTYRDIIHEEDQKTVLNAIQEDGMEPLKTFTIEYRALDANKKLRWFMETGQAVFSNEGEPLWLDGVISDISDRKFAEAALQEANKELERLASVDGLTQIANRRQFDECLEKEWKRMKRKKKKLSLILTDIDFFKLYNDNYGHQKGDECLKNVAKAIHSIERRPADLTARYGGEEFVMVLPDTDSAGAAHVAERIRKKVQSLQISHAHSKAEPVITLSLGVSTLVPDNDHEPKTLITAADEALYEAKESGRNRVVLNPKFV